MNSRFNMLKNIETGNRDVIVTDLSIDEPMIVLSELLMFSRAVWNAFLAKLLSGSLFHDDVLFDKRW